MNIYVVRHGQTDWNKKKILLGSTDKPLNSVGREQAAKLKNEFKNIKFDYYISSDLIRALETTQIISNNSLIIKNNKLRERSYGEIEGTSPKSVKEFWDVSNNVSKFCVEPIKDFLKRIFDELDNIINEYQNCDNILIVTHYGVVMAIDAYFNNKFEYCFEDFDLENCEYRKYKI